MTGIVQPDVIGQQAAPGRRDEAHLGAELTGLLAAPFEILRQGPVEEHHGLPQRQAVLGTGEAEHVHPHFPGDLGRVHTQRRHRVGETGAVHVDAELVAIRDSANDPQLVRCVNSAQLGGLGHAQGLGLWVEDVGAPGHQLLDALGGQLAVCALPQQQLGAVGGVLRAAALVGLDVGHLVADHAVKRLPHGGQGQGIGGRAVEHKVDIAVGVEQRPQTVRGPLGPGVLAVGRFVRPVGLRHGRPGLWADAAIVVTGKLFGLGQKLSPVSVSR